MSFFLYKPHVYGPEGVTTPDIIIDHIWANPSDEGEMIAPHMLTSETYVSASATTHLSPAYAIVAAGGGRLIAPVLCLDDGRYVLSRMAWRVAHLPGETVHLAFEEKAWALPEAETNLDMRGHCWIYQYAEQAKGLELPDRIDVVLAYDGGKPLRLTVHIQSNAQAFSHSKPRYSVGPTGKPVKHYI